MRIITVSFEDNGNVKVDTGKSTLAEILFASKLLSNNVEANLNQNNLEMMLNSNFETLSKFLTEKGFIIQDTSIKGE